MLLPPAAHAGGLSPRVRGNREHPMHKAAALRSIPACAGEPLGGRGWQATEKVYPRVCGGTAMLPPVRLHAHGLSPRVRGNRRRRDP